VQPDKAGIDDNAVSVVADGAVVYLPLDEMVDRERELERLNREKKKLMSEIGRAENKLANEGFMKKAPPRLIAEEQGKLEKFKRMLSDVEAKL